MALYVRALTPEEKQELERLLDHPEESPIPPERLMIVYLSSHGVKVKQIAETVGLHPINVRKWIHRFNARGLPGLSTRKSPGRPRVFTEEQRRKIVEVVQTPPEALGLDTPRWSLQRLRRYLIEHGIVQQISVETIRQILEEHGVRYRATRGWGGSAHNGTRNRGQSHRFGPPAGPDVPQNQATFSTYPVPGQRRP